AALEPPRAHPDSTGACPLAHAVDRVVLHRTRIGARIALGEHHVGSARVRRLVDERACLRCVAVLLGSGEGGRLHGGDAHGRAPCAADGGGHGCLRSGCARSNAGSFMQRSKIRTTRGKSVRPTLKRCAFTTWGTRKTSATVGESPCEN